MNKFDIPIIGKTKLELTNDINKFLYEKSKGIDLEFFVDITDGRILMNLNYTTLMDICKKSSYIFRNFCTKNKFWFLFLQQNVLKFHMKYLIDATLYQHTTNFMNSDFMKSSKDIDIFNTKTNYLNFISDFRILYMDYYYDNETHYISPDKKLLIVCLTESVGLLKFGIFKFRPEIKSNTLI